MADIPIWGGSSSFAPGLTPFGFYDTDVDFSASADKVADQCARRLGYPVVDVELQDIQFFAAFEEAVTEYGYQINNANIKNNLLNLIGASTGSDMTQRDVKVTLSKIVDIAQEYGSEAGVGGNVKWHTGSIQLISGQQRYDLDALIRDVVHPSESIEIKRIFHDAPPAIARYFDPFVGTGLGTQTLLDSFGFGSYSPGVQFLMMPLYDDLLRLQAIEFNDRIRKSAYSFRLIDNELTIFPVPTQNVVLHLEYIIKSDRANPLRNTTSANSNASTVSDPSNVPYENITYGNINSVGRQWIFRYTIALSKEMLGLVRTKYQSIPIPNSDITLNGNELLSQAQTEKDQLILEIREDLEKTSREAQMEKSKNESEYLQDQLSRIPIKIYVG